MVMEINMFIQFSKFRKLFYIIALILVAGSIYSLATFKLNLGIDFTGGSVLETSFKGERPSINNIRENLNDLSFEELSIQPIGDNGVLLKIKETEDSDNLRNDVLNKLNEVGEIDKDSFEFRSIGPVIGNELKEKTKSVVILSLLAILIYIAWSFRKLTHPLASWQYGIAALFPLIFDTLIILGAFALFGKLYGVQVTIPVITALLAVLGYSINDTVVVFDRMRENVLKGKGKYEEIIDHSVNETLGRSVSTSITTLIVVVAIFFLGGTTLKYFALTLIIGIISGTLSSLFLAPNFLVTWLKIRKRK
jgi:preprotein translocase subunit SecF